MQYKWNPRRISTKQHICMDSGMSLCKVENGSKAKMVVSDDKNPDRPMCGICEYLLESGGRKSKFKKPPTVRDIIADMIGEGLIQPGPNWVDVNWGPRAIVKV